MKVVYSLRNDLAKDPSRVLDTQSLTLNDARPMLGLKGNKGLFGSEEWWSNIDSGVIEGECVMGVITTLYVAGQDRLDHPNEFDFILDDGSSRSEAILTDDPNSISAYAPGRKVRIQYAYDELKCPLRNGCPQYLDLVVKIEIGEW
ncbi:hypothetical protein ROV86_07195 [Stenotrophomonas pavanii]|uniref:hypothetical protein n=1 Tax=Stenotrophomonas pavanii TaxID=487698 RepID=UPI002896161A|nr:hypothetical protein [Stenotrophomonas pavanii]MDT3527889.1 hypothetical protein [Stenotrophomonas pavanii]